jgi:eukaryotic-like serine/threonine-protein kinase
VPTTCPQCQQPIREGQSFCSKCGVSLKVPPAQTAPASADATNAQKPRATNQNDKSVGQQDEFVGVTLDGKYKIEMRLGAGGMGAVYLARRVQIGDDVALKLLHPQYVNDTSAVERFRREAQAAARLRHPNIVAIYDFSEGRSVGPAYIVMEMVNGPTLRAVLQKERRLEMMRAVHLISEICAGVGAAHRQNIIHRDLKPDNVIVVPPDVVYLQDDKEKIKVLDFGIAKLRDQTPDQALTQTGSVMGTPYYMSPEQCRGDELDSRSDVYSLSAMLYEMLTGAPPFTANTITGVVAKHLTESPAPLRTHLQTISPSLEAVVLRALAKDAQLRQADALAFARELQQAMQTPMPNHEIDAIIARTVSGAPSLGPLSPMPSILPAGKDAVGKAMPDAGPRSFDQPTRGRSAGAAAAAVAAAAEGHDGATEVKNLNRRLIVGASVAVAFLIVATGIVSWFLSNSVTRRPAVQPTPTPLAVASPSPLGTAGGSRVITATTDTGEVSSDTTSTVQVSRIESAETILCSGSVITEKDLYGLNPAELRLLRNVIFARHGRIFDTPGLQKYFAARAWYKANAGYSDEMLDATDRENVNMIFALENKAKATLTSGMQSSSKSSEKFAPEFARDERADTAWIEGAQGPGIGEWIAFTFKPQTIQTIEIYPGWGKSKELFDANHRIKRATLIFSDGTRASVELFDEMRLQAVRLSEPVKSSSLRLIIEEVYPGAKYDDAAIAEINWR